MWPKKKLIKENHYLLSGFRASSRSNGKHGLSRFIQSPLKAYSVIPVTHLSCIPCTHWPNVPHIASSPELYAHGTSQMLFVSEVTRNCDTQLLWAPLLMHWLHCRIRLHLQNSSSEVKLFRISRGNSKAWGPFECGALCDCTWPWPRPCLWLSARCIAFVSYNLNLQIGKQGIFPHNILFNPVKGWLFLLMKLCHQSLRSSKKINEIVFCIKKNTITTTD